jgi:hypothetical protein
MNIAKCHWLFIMEALVQFQASPCGICGGKL